MVDLRKEFINECTVKFELYIGGFVKLASYAGYAIMCKTVTIVG